MQNKTTVIDNWLRSYEQAQGEVRNKPVSEILLILNGPYP